MKNHFIYTLTFIFGLIIVACTPKVGDKVSENETTSFVESSSVDTIKPIIVKKRKFDTKETLPLDPHVRIGVLSNGMKYYIRKNSKPENRAELRLAVNVGSMQETDDQQGVAHFVEHMAFNGTKNFKKNELVNYLESIGTKFGPDLNAYTSFDETVYMLQIPTDDADILDKGLLIMQDWASNITFDKEEIDKERGVVLSEWRTGLGASERMRNQWFPIAFNGSRYAKRMPIGQPKIIKNASYATIESYYKKWYRPDLMALAIVGDFDLNEMEAKIKDRFEAIAKPATPHERGISNVPDHEMPLVAIAADAEATGTSIQIMYKKPHQEVKTIDDYQMQLMYDLYNGMLNQRLDELTRVAEPPYIYAYSGYASMVRPIDAYVSYILVPDNGIETGLKTITRENQRVKQHGFTLSELERQKTAILNSIQNAYNEKDKTPSNRYVMDYVYHFLEGEPMMGIEYKNMITQQVIHNIKLESVNTLAKKWLTEMNQAIVITMPKKSDVKIPKEEQILQWIKAAENEKVEPYEEEEGINSLMQRPKTGTTFYGTKKQEEVGVIQLNLPNGIRVILKPTDFKNDEILMKAFRRGGHSLYSDKDYMNAVLSDNITMESGLGGYSASQIEKFLAGQTVAVYPFVSELYEGFSGYASNKDLETMFQMIFQYYKNPNYNSEAAASLISKQISSVKNQAASPRYHFYKELNKTLYQNNYRRNIKTEDDYRKIDTKRASDIFKERFSTANNFTFVFVGSFTLESIKPLIDHYIGSLPRDFKNNEPSNYKNLNIKKPTGKIEKVVQKGQEPQSMVSLDFHGDFELTDLNSYTFASMAQVLRIMLRESMREEKGGVYGVNVSSRIHNEPDTTYSIQVSFMCAPDDVDELTKMVFEEIKNLKSKGGSDTNILKVQEAQRRERQRKLKENNFWLRQLESAYKHDRDLPNILKYTEDFVDYLDRKDVRNMAHLCFDTNQYIKIVLKPER